MHPNDIPALVYALTMVVVTGLPLVVEAEAAAAAAAAGVAGVAAMVESTSGEEVVVVVVAEADLVAVRVGQMAVSKVRAAIRARVAVGAVGSRWVAAVQLVLPSRWTLSQRFGFGLQESPSLHFQELACSRFRIAIG